MGDLDLPGDFYTKNPRSEHFQTASIHKQKSSLLITFVVEVFLFNSAEYKGECSWFFFQHLCC